MNNIASGMSYPTLGYLLVFLPISLIGYQLCPRRNRWIALLISSLLYYWMISHWLIIFLIGSAAITHYSCIWILGIRSRQTKNNTKEEARRDACCRRRKEKRVLLISIVILLGILIILKYYGFFAVNWNRIVSGTGVLPRLQPIDFLLPLGISFYTLQAIGYIADVYWGKADVTPSLAKTVLFLAFFPQIMEGPICSYGQTSAALWKGDPIRRENLTEGSVRILWGLFKKIVIADRLNVFVGAIFDNFANYHGAIIVLAAAAYTIQLYMEFSGCMDIVMGSGIMFGIRLPENFRQPFFSADPSEFWQRWHISLGTWFRTYIFYPIGVSAMVKRFRKFVRKHFGSNSLGKYVSRIGVLAMSMFPVWLCNGLWHGPRWSYIFFGFYYFAVILLVAIFEPVREYVYRKLHLSKEYPWLRCIRILKTWGIIIIGELFFRANGLNAGIHMFRSIFRGFSFQQLNSTLLDKGLDQADFLVVIAGCLIVFVADIVKEKNLLGDAGLKKLRLPLRWAVYYGLFFSVVLLGAYGIGYKPVDLIYAGF